MMAVEHLQAQSTLKDLIFLPGSAEYTDTTQTYFSIFAKKGVVPSAVFRPNDAVDISHFIVSAAPLVPQYDLRIAIKGSGHSLFDSAANIHGGITIDLKLLTGVQVNSEDGTVSIGAGERWGNFFRQLESKGLMCLGGRESQVGVGGLLLGGGLSFFSSERGFACDGLVNMQVVLASGDIIDANEHQNADLFKALKGGRNNFGIVTRFDLYTFPATKIWGGNIFFPGSTYPKLLQMFCDTTSSEDPDLKYSHMIQTVAWSPQYQVMVAGVCLAYTLPDKAPGPFLPFTTMEKPLVNTAAEKSVSSMTEELSSHMPEGSRLLQFATTVKADHPLLENVYTIWSAAIEPLKTIQGSHPMLISTPLPKHLLTASAAAAGNSLGLSPDDGPLVVLLLHCTHDKEEDDDTVLQTLLKTLDEINECAARMGKDARYRFTNYCYKDVDVIRSYGEASVAALKAVSQKYDPDGFFQKAVPGGFKLP